jgi:hypothetical protein
MLSKAKTLSLLRLLGERLTFKGIKGEMIIAGGTAMMLIHNAREATEDIDAVYFPPDIIDSIVYDLTIEFKLPHNWLNDSVSGFINRDAPVEDFMSFGSLKIKNLSANYLLAMKILSFREDYDFEDIKILIKALSIFSKDEIISLTRYYFPEESLSPNVNLILPSLIEDAKS